MVQQYDVSSITQALAVLCTVFICVPLCLFGCFLFFFSVGQVHFFFVMIVWGGVFFFIIIIVLGGVFFIRKHYLLLLGVFFLISFCDCFGCVFFCFFVFCLQDKREPGSLVPELAASMQEYAPEEAIRYIIFFYVQEVEPHVIRARTYI